MLAPFHGQEGRVSLAYDGLFEHVKAVCYSCGEQIETKSFRAHEGQRAHRYESPASLYRPLFCSQHWCSILGEVHGIKISV